MDVVHARCAGLDVHKATVVARVRVPGARREERRGETKTFATTLRGLAELPAWLIGHGVTHVAMESTGVYWRPVYAVLEGAVARGARERAAREDGAGPRRRTSAIRSGWRSCSNAACCGPASCRRPRSRDLRDLTRLRKTLIRERGHHVNRIEKTLELAQIKLSSVVTDLMGKTGRAILEALSAGSTMPRSNSPSCAQGLLRTEARRAPRGPRGPAHPALRLPAPAAPDADRGAGRPYRHARCPDRGGDGAVRRGRARWLQTMPGVAPAPRRRSSAETGVDMAPFPTAAHFALLGATVLPATTRAPGKRQPTTTGDRAPTWLRATAARSRLGGRRGPSGATTGRSTTGSKGGRGPKKAIVAVQHAMRRSPLAHAQAPRPSHDLGPTTSTACNTARLRRHHVRRARTARLPRRPAWRRA